MSVLGAGLLLGVALAVIIPEGLQTLIKAYNTSPADLGKENSHDILTLVTSEGPQYLQCLRKESKLVEVLKTFFCGQSFFHVLNLTVRSSHNKPYFHWRKLAR